MGNLARDVLFRMPSARLYAFCLLIVRYTLSGKIKGKSALKARTSLHENVTKFMYVIGLGCLCIYLSTENSADSIFFKTLHWQNVYL